MPMTAKDHLSALVPASSEVNTSLINAARTNNKKQLLEAIEAGANINFKDQRFKTALYWTCFGGHTECVSILIDNGANVDSVCGRQDDTTPLLASIQFNHPECLRILLEKGASIESLSSGYTGSPVEEAILNDRVDCLSILIEYGASVESEDRFGSTPLHFAAKYGKVNCATMLLNHGANPNVRDSENMTPLENVAEERGYPDVADLFLQNGDAVSVNNSQLSQTSFLYAQNGSQTQPLSQTACLSEYEDSQIIQPFSYHDIGAVTNTSLSQDLNTSSSMPSSSSFSLSLLDSSQLSQYSQQSQLDSQDLHPMKPPRYVVPNWEIESSDLEMMEEIGCGFYGKVFRAMWQGGTQVAVKHLHVVSAEGKVADLVRKNFRLEMEMLMALRHPNIVLFLGVCIQSPNLHLVMEYMPRGSLSSVLHSNTGKTLGMKARVKMAMDVACGMNYLHKQSPEPILHRDLKSSNLLVTEDLRVKVSDFGLARVKDGGFKARNPLDVTILAPEVLKSKIPHQNRFTEKSDVYSYGLLLWEIVTVQPLFVGKEPKQVVLETMNKNRPPIPSSCPAALKQLISRCWDEDPTVRPTFQDIVKELRTIANN